MGRPRPAQDDTTASSEARLAHAVEEREHESEHSAIARGGRRACRRDRCRRPRVEREPARSRTRCLDVAISPTAVRLAIVRLAIVRLARLEPVARSGAGPRVDGHRRDDHGSNALHGHAPARWKGARGRGRDWPERRSFDELGRALRPGQRYLERDREHAGCPRQPHRDPPSEWHGAGGRRRR